ncbi:MAG: IS4 family transposase [Planctomycetales bacterium]
MARQQYDVVTNAQALNRAFRWVFGGAGWVEIPFRSNAKWTPQTLAAVACLIPCNDRENITDAFEESRDMARSWDMGSVAESFQGFFKRLIQHGQALLAIVVQALRMRMRELMTRMRVEEDDLLFAVDGSRLELARTKNLQKRFCGKGPKSKRKGKKKTKSQQKKADSPQAWLTVLYSLNLGMPWDFRCGPSGSSEREHFLEMLSSLPAKAVITADAGFVGYDFWSALLQANTAFVIRVGANVKLLKRLGATRFSGEIVSLWPDQQRKKQAPPLTLRLVRLQGVREQVYLVTNVLDEEQLSEERIITIYHKRWRIELYYRAFKQTFGKRKMRCASADNVEQELTWSVVSLWMMTLYAASQRFEAGETLDSLSPAGVIKAFREAIRQWPTTPAVAKSLDVLIRAASKDAYVRTSKKTNKEYPRKKKKKKLGAPTIKPATPEQIQQAREVAFITSA